MPATAPAALDAVAAGEEVEELPAEEAMIMSTTQQENESQTKKQKIEF